MGIVIRCMNAEFTNTVGIADYPIVENLKNLYFIGDTAAASVLDKSGNQNTANVEGTITFENYYGVFSGDSVQNRIIAQTTDSAAIGISCVALLKQESGARAIVSNIGPSSSLGTGFSFGNAMLTYKGDSWVQKSYTLPTTDEFISVAVVIDGNGYKVYYDNKDTGLSLLASGTASGFVNNGNNLCIGGDYRSWANNGTEDLAIAAYYEAVLTETQIADAFSFMRLYGEKNGLSVY